MKNRKLKTFSRWEWEVLVAAWRYYEHRHTIASASFPHEVVRRYFSGEYDEASCDSIACQFVGIDHYRGPDSKLDGWVGDDALGECDRRAWRLFYWFLKAWHEAGFRELRISFGKNEERVVCFNADGKWYAKDGYIWSGEKVAPYRDEEIIKEGARE